jgi:3-dehydroquinate synthase
MLSEHCVTILMMNRNKTMVETDAALVEVELGERSYPIHIAEGLLKQAGELIGPVLSRAKTVIVTDENVAALHLATLQKSLDDAGIRHDAIVLPPGEATKSYEKLAFLCDALLEKDVERKDVVIAFGGGVVGDLAGFAAAILRRGVSFIQIPTSLLAQVDSSVGGKTGINSKHGKNLVGAFHQPLMVIIDIALLDTLPPRQLASGYAEVAKYGLLGDIGFFEWLEANAKSLFAGDGQVRIAAISKSCEAKADIVARDEKESGVRALLNLGHTFGHALETATGYGDRLLHGEGVSVGMVLAFKFCEQQGMVSAGTAKRVADHLASTGLPVHLCDISGDLGDAQTLVRYMRQDKKASGGKLVFVFARAIGDSFVANDVCESDILAFMAQELKNR